jgi:hypothetical protein
MKLMLACGPEAVKNLEGYVRVILLPVPSSPPADVLKPNVATTPLLPVTRSAAAILNETSLTEPLIGPDGTGSDNTLSELVETIT